jgi:hypothetical protein
MPGTWQSAASDDWPFCERLRWAILTGRETPQGVLGLGPYGPAQKEAAQGSSLVYPQNF